MSNALTCSGCSCCTQCPAPSNRWKPTICVHAVLREFRVELVIGRRRARRGGGPQRGCRVGDPRGDPVSGVERQ